MSPCTGERPSLIPTLKQVSGQQSALVEPRRPLAIGRSLSLLALRPARPDEPASWLPATSGLACRARRWTRELFATSSSPNLLLGEQSKAEEEEEEEEIEKSCQKKEQDEKGKHKPDWRQKNNISKQSSNLTGARKFKIQAAPDEQVAHEEPEGETGQQLDKRRKMRIKEQRAFWHLR